MDQGEEGETEEGAKEKGSRKLTTSPILIPQDSVSLVVLELTL